MPPCFLSATGDVWQRLKRYVLLSSTRAHAKEQKLTFFKLWSAWWQCIKLKIHKDDKRHLLDESVSLMKWRDRKHLSPAGGYLHRQVKVHNFLHSFQGWGGELIPSYPPRNFKSDKSDVHACFDHCNITK